MGESLVNISSDDVEDFIKKASAAVGSDGEMGETTYDIQSKYSVSGGKVSKVTFTLKVDIRRAHWSGGKPDAKNKKAILEAEAANKKHEEKHKKLAEDIFKREVAKI